LYDCLNFSTFQFTEETSDTLRSTNIDAKSYSHFKPKLLTGAAPLWRSGDAEHPIDPNWPIQASTDDGTKTLHHYALWTHNGDTRKPWLSWNTVVVS